MKDTLTADEAAVFIGRHVSNIYRWIEHGHLKASDDPHDGTMRIKVTDLRAAERKVKRGRRRGGTTR